MVVTGTQGIGVTWGRPLERRLPRRWSFAGLLLALALPACSYDPGRSSTSGSTRPVILVDPPSCDQPNDPLIFWIIRGFKTEQLVNPNAPSEALLVQLRVGDTVPLSVESTNTFGVDCTGTLASINWAYTNAGVVELEPPGAVRVVLTGVRAGDTRIFAELRFKNGESKRAEPFVFSNVGSGAPGIRVVSR